MLKVLHMQLCALLVNCQQSIELFRSWRWRCFTPYRRWYYISPVTDAMEVILEDVAKGIRFPDRIKVC